MNDGRIHNDSPSSRVAGPPRRPPGAARRAAVLVTAGLAATVAAALSFTLSSEAGDRVGSGGALAPLGYDAAADRGILVSADQGRTFTTRFAS